MKLPWKKERNKKLISSIMAMTFALSTGFPYMNNLSSVIGGKTAHASSMSEILMYQAMAGSSGSSSSSANMSMMMALSGGFNISSKVKYVYYVPSDLENVTIICTAGTTK